MSISQLFDTDEERAYWFGALADLSDAVSVSVIVTNNPLWALLTISTGVVGRKVSGYYKLKVTPKDEHKP